MRLQNYMEDNELYPRSMFGFRAKLSTQDVLLQHKEEVTSNVLWNGEHVIMALDIKGAFENVSHEAILTGMDSLNCGRKIHGCVKAFLSNRTATIGLEEVRPEKFRTPNKETPQRSVISLILLNIAMIGLARQLEQIEGTRHAMYADEITVWVNRGSFSEKEECLQKAATCVETYAMARGFACSMEKSELLRVWRGKQNRMVPTIDELKLNAYLEGQPIPEKTTIRILGMWLQSNQRCNHTLTLLKTATMQLTRMIKQNIQQETRHEGE
ncbi:putative nicotine oxidoreductase [Amblyomma americanum]